MLPVVILLLGIGIFPSAYSLYVSFHSWRLIQPELGFNFVGVGNYVDAFASDFGIAFVNTLLYVIGAVSIEFVLGFAIAMLLSSKIRGIAYIRMTLVIPAVLPAIVVGHMFRYMLFPGYGVFGYMLNQLGAPRGYGLLSRPDTVLPMITLLDVWMWTGFVSLVLLAGIQSLPLDVLEMSDVDGVTRWQKIRFVIMPMLKPIIVTILLLRTIDTFKIFDLIYVTTGGGPGVASESVTSFIWRQGLVYFKMGDAAAMSWIVLLVVMVVTTLYVKVVYRGEAM